MPTMRVAGAATPSAFENGKRDRLQEALAFGRSVPVLMVRCIIVAIRIISGLLVALLVGMTGGQVWQNSPASGAAEPGPQPASVSTSGKLWRGVASCSAASCHGGGQEGMNGSEQTTWAARDPHARAYEVLFDLRSRVIVKNLEGLTDIRQAHPEKMTLCLQCHVSPAVAARPGIPARFHADGVSCETCHGPAEAWLTQHYRPAWKQLSQTEKAATGFRATRDLPTRVSDCVACHVGLPGMEVNHDLLAAGHPRLQFEFASFQAIFPKHWRPSEDRTRYPDFEARSWAMGQVVAAKAALDLLAHRAGNPDSPWPELAESNCYGCHQNVTAQRSGRNRPTFSLNEWYFAELPTVLGLGAKPMAPGELDALRAEMARPVPRRQQAAALARPTAAILANWLEQPLPPFTPEQLRRLLADRVGTMEKDPSDDRDKQTQDYLAAAACFHALKDLDPRFSDSAATASLRRQRARLGFVKGNSP